MYIAETIIFFVLGLICSFCNMYYEAKKMDEKNKLLAEGRVFTEVEEMKEILKSLLYATPQFIFGIITFCFIIKS